MRGTPGDVRSLTRLLARATAVGGLALAASGTATATAGAAPIPTQTTIRCAGIGVSGMRSCRVGVYADMPKGAPAPTGTLSWTSSGPGSQTVTTECAINAYDENVGPPFPNVVWCENGYMSPGEIAPRTESIVATYSGDALYAGSVGTTTYYVRDPNGTIPETTEPAQPAWRPQPAGDKHRETDGSAAPSPTTGPAAVSGLAARRTGLSFASSAPAASVIRIERRVRRAGSDGRTTTSWRTVRRLERTLTGGTNRIGVRLRPGVHRITIGGASVRRTQRTLTVRG